MLGGTGWPPPQRPGAFGSKSLVTSAGRRWEHDGPSQHGEGPIQIRPPSGHFGDPGLGESGNLTRANHFSADIEASFRLRVDQLIEGRMSAALAPIIQQQAAQAAEIQALVRHIVPPGQATMADRMFNIETLISRLVEGMDRISSHSPAPTAEDPAGTRPPPKPPEGFPPFPFSDDHWVWRAAARTSASFPFFSAMTRESPSGIGVLTYWCLRALAPADIPTLVNPYVDAARCAICFDDLEPSTVCVLTCGHTYCEGCAERAMEGRLPCQTCHRPSNPLGWTRDLGLSPPGPILDMLALGRRGIRVHHLSQSRWCANLCGRRFDERCWHCANCDARFCGRDCLTRYDPGYGANVGVCRSCLYINDCQRHRPVQMNYLRAHLRRLRGRDAEVIFNFMDHIVPWKSAWIAGNVMSLPDPDYLKFVTNPA